MKLFSRRSKLSFNLLGGLLFVAGVAALVSTFWISTSDAITVNNPAVDLISNQDWTDMPGASKDASGIQINPLGRAIVNQNGSDNQDNPPVNVRGPHVAYKNNVEVDLRAAQIPTSGTASFYLYSGVPIIYDEWRYQPPQLRIDLNQQKVTIYEWNGRSDKPKFTQSWSYQIGSGAYVAISINKKSSNFGLQVNGIQLGIIKAKNVFNSGQLWFGADASVGSGGWIMQALVAQSAIGQKLSVLSANPIKVSAVNDTKTLKALSSNSQRNLPIGSAVAVNPLFSDLKYQQLVSSQLNLIVPENELKPQSVHPQPNTYSFTEADSLVDFAMSNGMTVHGHTLEFSEANPKWMQIAPLADRQKILTDHITTVVSHFGTKINEWDVVDEPLNDNDDNHGNSRDLRKNIWFAAMGENYIDQSFKAARAANPSAQLYINEYGLEADGSRWDEFISLIKRLQARGVPIDGVGFQAHVHESGDEIDAAVLQSHIKLLDSMGLKSRISEMDVYGDDPVLQASQFTAGLKACTLSPSCTSFTMWGLTDKYGSTTDLHNYPLSYGNDLVWDENLQAKPAYNSLQTWLSNQ